VAIIVYCNYPNEATAAVIAKQLIAHGFREVRPLIGGLDAWNAHSARPAVLPEPLEALPS
jgi:rhodanese-related sulfurtransferase